MPVAGRVEAHRMHVDLAPGRSRRTKFECRLAAVELEPQPRPSASRIAGTSSTRTMRSRSSCCPVCSPSERVDAPAAIEPCIDPGAVEAFEDRVDIVSRSSSSITSQSRASGALAPAGWAPSRIGRLTPDADPPRAGSSRGVRRDRLDLRPAARPDQRPVPHAERSQGRCAATGRRRAGAPARALRGRRAGRRGHRERAVRPLGQGPARVAGARRAARELRHDDPQHGGRRDLRPRSPLPADVRVADRPARARARRGHGHRIRRRAAWATGMP